MAKKKKVSKKKAPGKAVATRKQTLPTDWKSQMRKDAQEQSERVPIGTGNRITLKRNGQFSFQNADLGDSLDVIIVDHVVAKLYFDQDYDEDNPVPPACFALKPNSLDIAPHEEAPDPQAEICSECWANEWASGRGRGKACSDKNRLAVLSAEDPEGDLMYLEVPVTSGAAFNKYIKGLTKATELPSYAVITRLEMDDHADYQKLIFTLIDEVPEKDMAGPFNKREEAREMLMEPYDTSSREEESGKKAKKRKTKKKKVTRKKRSKKKVAKKKRRSRVS